MLRSLGVDLDGPTLMLGDNMSVVLNISVPSSVVKKKHNAISYHQVWGLEQLKTPCVTLYSYCCHYLHILFLSFY
jgi:hypothetical protein